MTDKNDYVTHREYTREMESLRRWLASELIQRDRAVDVAREELKLQYEHLNNLRQGVVQKDSFERDSKAMDKRIVTLEAFRNKSIGIVMAVTTIGGIFGGVVGYMITHMIQS